MFVDDLGVIGVNSGFSNSACRPVIRNPSLYVVTVCNLGLTKRYRIRGQTFIVSAALGEYSISGLGVTVL